MSLDALFLGEKPLSELHFSDLFLSSSQAWFAGTSGTKDPIEAPPYLNAQLSDLRSQCADACSRTNKSDFQLTYCGMKLRVALMRAIRGDVFVCRRFGSGVMKLTALGLHPGVVKRIMTPGLTGLVLIAGPTGSGKTTTATSYIKARLERFGGVAVTAEDPPEVELEGSHGNGVCFQTEINAVGGFAQACKNIVRWRPTIIFLGEIRDSATASEALRACINGHLVISTVHSDGVITAIQRINALASAEMPGEAPHLLSNGLQAVMHQKMEIVSGRRIITTENLLLVDERFMGARQIIRDNKLQMLSTDIEQFKNLLSVESRSGAYAD